MNILSVGGNYKPGNTGNAKRISTMCEQFVALGHNVTVCTVAKAADGSLKEEQISGVNVCRFEDSNELSANVNSVAKRYSSDVILIHNETYVRKLKAIGVDIPVVYECHAIESNPSRLKEFILKGLRRIYFTKSFVKAVFVLSENAKKQVNKEYKYPIENIFRTPNGVEKTEYSDRPASFGNNEDFIYGYSGTLYEFQGIKVLLQYLKQILDIADDVKVMIVGGGHLEEEVREYVKANNLEERVIVTGQVSQQEFDEYTSKFDVMLMPRPSNPSTESAVPLKIFDAAIHKKPVVMSNVSGLTEAFSDEAALIYDTKNTDGFVDCCKKLYRNKELAASLVEGEKKAMEKWPSVEEVAQIQLDVMSKTVGKV